MATDWIKSQIQGLLHEAGDALKAMNWETVYQRAQAILVLDPENADANALSTAAERGIGNSSSQPPSP